MSGVKRTVIAALLAVVLVAAIFTLLTVFPVPTLGRAAVVIGFPLGYIILKLTPESFFRWLSPGGGPDAVSWAFAISTLLTWYLLVFAVCFLAIGRMRSNTAIDSDTVRSQLRAPHGARHRER
jgi:hypothetical protein